MTLLAPYGTDLAISCRDFLKTFEKNPDHLNGLFSEILKLALNLYPMDRFDASEIAKEFEVAETTVLKWVEEEARPHPNISATIVKWILEESHKYFYG